MVGRLLARGMIVGLFAGLLCFAFLRTVGEPIVDRAIAFEAAHAASHSHAPDAGHDEEELVSRPIQAGLGLFTGVVVYAAAFGGIFALVFALAYGRLGALGPRGVAALLAAAGFVVIHVVPMLKYPANPPSIGLPETIGLRTGLYFAMIVLSVVSAILANLVYRRLQPTLGTWDAASAAALCFIALAAAAILLLPTVDEVPAMFPASALWRFRMVSIGAQALLWAVFGLVFGRAAESVLRTDGRVPLRTVLPRT